MSKDLAEIAAYKWYVVSMVVGFIVGVITPYSPQVIPFFYSFVDPSCGPCNGIIKITSPKNGSTVYGNSVVVEGTCKVEGNCKCVVLIMTPLAGSRSRHVSETVTIHLERNQGIWSALARIEDIPPAGRVRVSARLCPKPSPYPPEGCIEKPPIEGIASNTIVLVKGE